MTEDINQVNMLVRREIEARMAGPLIEQFCEALGTERALAEVDKVVQRLAREAGAQAAQAMGGNSMELFHKATEMWKKAGPWRSSWRKAIPASWFSR